MNHKPHDLHRDPITGTPGSHPLGVGLGGAGGAAAGAVIGSLAGPIGTLVCGTIGAVVGAAAGKDVAENIDPTALSEEFLHEQPDSPPMGAPAGYDSDYGPAYTYGIHARTLQAGRIWDDVLESELERGWDQARGNSRMAWAEAKAAVRDAWQRAGQTEPGDAGYNAH